MKFIFISFVIFTLLSLGYLAYFFFSLFNGYGNLVHNKNLLIRFIVRMLFPLISFAIILFDIVYISIFYKDIVATLIIIFFLFLIYLGFFNLFDEGAIHLIFSFIGIAGIIVIFAINNIELEKREVTSEIKLYEQDVTRDDLCGIIIELNQELFSSVEYYIVMQYSENDVKNLEEYSFDNSIYCSKFKFIETDENRIVFSHTETIKCNFFYSHGFTNLKPETIIDDDSYEKILYINKENIIEQNN